MKPGTHKGGVAVPGGQISLAGAHWRGLEPSLGRLYMACRLLNKPTPMAAVGAAFA